jgi:uncharacterized damage-inducible protein DinB
MTELTRYTLRPAEGMKSRLVGLFLWQLDEQSRELRESTRGATPEELAWQQAPGMNTIGMLLAHIAVVEVSWIGRGVHGLNDLAPGVLPIGRTETGMPLPEGQAPPAALEGRDLAWFDDLLERSRAYTRRELAPLTDADLDRMRFRRGPTGEEYEFSIGWMLYHILEHLAGHHYQVNLLRHQYRALRQAGAASAR